MCSTKRLLIVFVVYLARSAMQAWDGVAYGASFDTVDGKWQTVKLPFTSFQPIMRAKTASEAPAFNPKNLCSMQIMLSKFEYNEALNPAFKAGNIRLVTAVTTEAEFSYAYLVAILYYVVFLVTTSIYPSNIAVLFHLVLV